MTKAPDKYKRDPAYGRAKAWGPVYDEHFPHDTDGYSRHVKVIAEDVLRATRSEVRRLLIDAGYEPDHWARSMEVTVEQLWKARQRLREVGHD